MQVSAVKGLVTNYEEGGGQGVTKREGGHVKFYPYEKGGRAEKVLAMLKGGQKNFWGSFYKVAWSFRHIEARGGAKSFALSWGGTQKVSDPRFSHSVAPPPPLPVINNQSLRCTEGSGTAVCDGNCKPLIGQVDIIQLQYQYCFWWCKSFHDIKAKVKYLHLHNIVLLHTAPFVHSTWAAVSNRSATVLAL